MVPVGSSVMLELVLAVHSYHVIAYLVPIPLHIYEYCFIFRAFWFFIFGGLVYYLVSTSITQTARFLEYKTATKTTLTHEKNMTFPAITICNFNLIKNDSVTDPKTRALLKELFMKLPNITFIEELGHDFLSNVSLRELFANGTPGIEETFLICLWLRDYFDCRDLLVPKETDFGHCYSFGSKDNNETYTVHTPGYQDGVTFTMWLNQDNYFIGDTSSAGIKVNSTLCCERFYVSMINKWAATWQNQQNECAPIRPVWSESSLCAQWVAKDPSFLHADSEDSDQICTDAQADLSLRWAHNYIVGFVMSRLKCLIF